MKDAARQDWMLEPELESLWERLEEQEPRRRRGLGLNAIVTTAVGIADAEGMEAVSMARIAKELGFATMAIYRHVPHKAALVVLMIDRAVGAPPPLDPACGSWRDQLTLIAEAQVARFRDHRWLLDLPVSTPPATPNNLRWMNALLVALRDLPLAAAEKLQALVMVTSYVRGFIQLSGGDSVEGDAVFFATITRIAQGEDFAELRRVLIDQPADGVPSPPEDEFVFGFGRLLDGLDALVTERGGTRPQSPE